MMTTIPITTDDDIDDDGAADAKDEEVPIEDRTYASSYERAVTILRDGNEIQRISVLRTLPGMVSTNGNNQENCLIRVLPEIQETLTSGTAGLELHFEASQAYKDIVEQASHSDPNLCAQILQGIVQNLDAQDSIACSAWLETLLDIISHLPLHLVHTTILPLAVHKSQQLNSIQSRLMASKLLGRLAYKLDPVDVKMQIVPLVQALCQDIDAGVRASVCQQLSIVAYSLPLAELKSVALPIVIEFSKDEDESVREANLETLVSLLNLFDDETCAQILVPLIERFVGEIVERKSHKTLVALSKNYGALCQGLNRILSFKQKDWFMEKFGELCKLGAEEEDEENNGEFHKMLVKSIELSREQHFEKNLNLKQINSCFKSYNRLWENAQTIAQLAGSEKFKTSLLPHFKKLCQDSETDVRRNVALNFHELVKFMGADAPLLIDSFIDLVYSGEPEVIAALTVHLATILEYLYQANSRPVDTNGNFDDNVPYSHTQLTRILLACNRLIRNCSNWRCHEQFLLALTCMKKCVSKEILLQSYVPMMKEEVLNTRALPCRVAALKTLILWMKDLTSPAHLQSIVEFLTITVIQHKSCHKRTLYLDACQLILDYLPSQFFKQYFFRPALQMSKDPVLNIRAKLCKMLPLFKKTLSPSNDYDLLSELELVMRTFMNERNTAYMNEILRNVVNELTAMEEVKETKSGVKPPQPVPVNKKVEPESKVATSSTNNKREEKKVEVATVAPTPKHQTTTVVYLHQDLDVKAKLPPPAPNNHKVMKVIQVEVVPQQEQQQQITVTSTPQQQQTKQDEPQPPKKSRSPSPPRRHLITTVSGVPKKTAVIKPRQLVTRSPSPRPPFKEDLMKKPPTLPGRTLSSTNSSGSNLLSRRSSDSYSKYNSSSNERIVPIKLVTSASSSSVSALRPPTPITTYRRQKDREKPPPARPIDDTKLSTIQTRTIPIVRTGSVLKSVEKFETSDLNSNRPPLRAAPSSNLGYSRALNRSFSSFSSPRGLGDYNNNGDLHKDRTSISSLGSVSAGRRSSLASNPSSLSTPIDRSFSLTRVRSGSSLIAPSSASTSSGTYSRFSRK